MKISFRLPHSVIAILLFFMAIAVAVWLLQPADSGTVAARAGAVQAAVAAVLLLVTWLSIGRSDKQIEVANELLQAEYRHNLVFDLEGDNLVVANISKMTIFVSRIRYEVVAHRVFNTSLASHISLMPGEVKKIKIQGIFEPQDPSIDRYSPYAGGNLEDLQRKLDSQWQPRYLHVSYMYGGTGNKKYGELFKIAPHVVPWRSEEPVNWVELLTPMKDYDTPLEEE